MGRIGKFFGCPGDRPALHHRAPLIPHNQDVIQQLDPNIRHVHTNHLKSSRETLVGDDTHSSINNSSSNSDNVSSNSDNTGDDDAYLSDSSTKLDLADVLLQENGCIDTNMSFTGIKKSHMDIWLDKAVMWAGSQIMFFLMWIILIVWVIIGAVYNAPFNWQVVMQDGQSIQCYFWDTLLTRQQLTSTHEQVLIVTQLRSRVRSFKRFLLRDPVITDDSIPIKLMKTDEEVEETVNGQEKNTANDLSFLHTNHDNSDGGEEEVESDEDDSAIESKKMSNKPQVSVYTPHIDHTTISGALPVENWYDRLSTTFSWMIGSVPSMILFWLCIFAWVGCGAVPQGGETFSNNWQMEINTAVAVSLLISSFFLQNIRARHDIFISKFLLKIHSMDCNIDLILRTANNDFTSENPIVTVDPPKRTKAEHLIDWYADVVGTGIGIVIAICVFAVWAAIGSPLHWSDDWWLIIGTYTGLVGFLDGFVIRQVYFRIINHEEENFKNLADEDAELFQLISIECPEEYFVSPKHKRTLSYRISEFVNLCCSTQWSVLVSILIIVGLICAASGMLWSTTGQLIANTPTMIIEEFFMIVLIQAHNWADEQRRIEISGLFARRHILLEYVQNKYINVQH